MGKVQSQGTNDSARHRPFTKAQGVIGRFKRGQWWALIWGRIPEIRRLALLGLVFHYSLSVADPVGDLGRSFWLFADIC
jgi:hypothetical protein